MGVLFLSSVVSLFDYLRWTIELNRDIDASNPEPKLGRANVMSYTYFVIRSEYGVLY